MKVLSDLIYKVPLEETAGDMNVVVSSVQFDSRKVASGCMYVAVKGTTVDGHNFISDVVDKGALVVVCEILPEVLKDGVSYVRVADTHEALGLIASNFYDNPSTKLNVVAITGTNGKTSNVTLLYRLFLELGYSTGLLSTVENRINEDVIPATHTTPDAVGLNALLARMVEEGCTHCFIEASSHAIHQRRIAGLNFVGAVFTNISHDHLDYHETFDAYIKAKKMLFDGLPKSAFALINGDDRRANVMVQNCKARTKFFSVKSMGEYNARIVENSLEGLELDIDGRHAWFNLIGEFNAYNLLSVYAVAVELGENEEEVLTSLTTLSGASGRFEKIISREKILGIVDYAHTPDALENVLTTIESIQQGRSKVITVVGCGGNRDKDKRPVMAEIAARLSDQVIITSDNPRDEDPQEIINDMMEGVGITQKRKVLSMLDRQEAIKLAVTLAEPNDVILLAGKGHEDYQEIKGERHHFDDKEILQSMFNLFDK